MAERGRSFVVLTVLIHAHPPYMAGIGLVAWELKMGATGRSRGGAKSGVLRKSRKVPVGS